MSITGRYLRVSPDVIRDIQRQPSTILDVIYPEPEPRDHSSRYLDIDKTWHIIHFLLTGDAWVGEGPLFDAVLGGHQLTDEDLGYGPARFLNDLDVVATARALDCISPEELWSRFEESRIREAIREANLYWSIEPDGRNYALENYEALRRFFAAAAHTGEAAILWLA
jgi:hypothetical protein